MVYSTHHIPGFPPAIEEQFQSRHAVSLRINKGIVNGKQTFEEIDAPLNQLTNVSQYDVDDFVDQVSTPDINGDGLSDLVYYNDDHFNYAINDGSRLVYKGTLVHIEDLEDAKLADFSLVDLNRDGYPDAVWHDFLTNSYGYIKSATGTP